MYYQFLDGAILLLELAILLLEGAILLPEGAILLQYVLRGARQLQQLLGVVILHQCALHGATIVQQLM
jgi:hypothetical protein